MRLDASVVTRVPPSALAICVRSSFSTRALLSSAAAAESDVEVGSPDGPVGVEPVGVAPVGPGSAVDRSWATSWCGSSLSATS